MVIMGVFICKQLVHSCRSSAPKIRGHCSCVCNLKSELVTESKIIYVYVPFTNKGSSTYNSVTSNTHIRTSQTRSGSNYPWLGVKVTCTLSSNDILTCQKDMILLYHCSPSNRMMFPSVILKNFACKCMYITSGSRTANYSIKFYHNFNLVFSVVGYHLQMTRYYYFFFHFTTSQLWQRNCVLVLGIRFFSYNDSYSKIVASC